MKLLSFKLEKADPEQFVSFWSERYDEGKYPDEYYLSCLNIEGDLEDKKIIVNGNETTSIKYLWEWKNGKRLSPKKKPVIKKTINKLNEINRFRKLPRVDSEDISQFYKMTYEIVPTGLIWNLFLLHVARPNEFPIFDQHVFRAFNFINEIQADIPAEPQDMKDYENYKNFFWNFVKESNKNWREVDKALMAFGQFLKSQFYKNNIGEESK